LNLFVLNEKCFLIACTFITIERGDKLAIPVPTPFRTPYVRIVEKKVMFMV